MPIINPNVNTNIEAPAVQNRGADLLLQMLLQGQKAGADSAQLAQHAKNEDASTKLKSLLAGQEDKAKIDRDLEAANSPQLQSLLHKGGSFKVGEVAVGAAPKDPLASYMQHGADQDTKARQLAVKTYTDETKKTEHALGGAKQMIDAIEANNPNAHGNIVQGYMTAHGFARFNTPEAMQLAQPSVQEGFVRLLQKVGLTPQDYFQGKTLNPSQVQMFAQDANDILGTEEAGVNAAKERSLGNYKVFANATPQGVAALDTLGAPHLNTIAGLRQRNSKFMAPAPAAPTQAPSPIAPPTAMGGPAPQGPNPVDAEAIKWATDPINATNPDSMKIKQLHGIR